MFSSVIALLLAVFCSEGYLHRSEVHDLLLHSLRNSNASCLMSVSQIALSGNLVALWTGVPQHDGNYAYCTAQPESKYCNLFLKYVCVPSEGGMPQEIVPAVCPLWPRPGVPASSVCVPTSCSELMLSSVFYNLSHENVLLSPLLQAAYSTCPLGGDQECDKNASYVLVSAECPDPNPGIGTTGTVVTTLFAVWFAWVALCSALGFVSRLLHSDPCIMSRFGRVLCAFDLYYGLHDLCTLKVYATKVEETSNPLDSDHADASQPQERPQESGAQYGATEEHNHDEFVLVCNTNFLNGVRLIAMLLVIYGHCGYFPLLSSDFDNDTDLRAFLTSYASILSYPAILAVDVFFFISGFLGFHLFLINHRVVRARVESAKNDHKLNDDEAPLIPSHSKSHVVHKVKKVAADVLLAYFHRYLRLTPLVLIVYVIGVWAVPPYLNGPMAAVYTSYEMLSQCDENSIWRIALYITSLKTEWVACVGWFWYMSSDFQLFLFLPFFALGYYASKAATISLLLALMSVSVGLAIHYNPIGNQELYSRAYLRMSPYIYGMLTAVAIREPRVVRAVHNWKVRSMLYGFCTTALVGTINLTWYFGKRGYEGDGGTASNGSDNRSDALTVGTNFMYLVGWGLGLGGFTVAWAVGYGGALAAWLGHSVFSTLSKLTFSCYLIHPIIILTSVASGAHVGNFTQVWLYIFFAGIVVWSFLCGAILYLFVEHPAAALTKLLAPAKRAGVKSCPQTHV